MPNAISLNDQATETDRLELTPTALLYLARARGSGRRRRVNQR